jgi:dipeptidyl-peptidase-4
MGLNSRLISRAIGVVLLLASSGCVHVKPAQVVPGQRLSLARLQQDPPLAGRQPIGVKFSPDGKWLAFLKGSEKDSKVLDLWGVLLSEKGAKPKRLVRTVDLVAADRIELSEEERMANERKRIRHRGITSYHWCGRSGRHLLFPLSGYLFLVDLQSKATQRVRRLGPKGPKLNVQCSPKGTFISYVTAGELFTIDVAHAKVVQRTRGASKTRQFGIAEFIAQEEMGRYYGHVWSPSERYLLYSEVDLSPVGVKVRPMIYATKTTLYRQRYPAAGEANAKVLLHVLDLTAGQRASVALPTEDGYLPRFGWAGKGRLFVQWQSRNQTRLDLHIADLARHKMGATGGSIPLTRLWIDRDKAWVALHNDLRFTKAGRFIWPSEHTGVRQLYLHDKDGTRLKAVTKGRDPVMRITAFNKKTGLLHYVRATQRGRSRQLYSTVAQEGPGSERLLTPVAGWHKVKSAPDGKAFLDAFSLPVFSGHGPLGKEGVRAWFLPPRVTLRGSLGEVRFVLEPNPAEAWQNVTKTPGRYVTVRAKDGTALNARVFPPARRIAGKRYPVIVYVYGGPGAQVVTHRYNGSMPLWAAFNQRGFGVFMLDNRGSGGRNHAFTRAIHHRIGDIEVEDQKAGVAFLKTLDWVDPDRIGVYGWSYGGFMSAKLMSEPKTPFAAGAAIAPVTDWALYDTHYTERFLGRPQEAPERYRKAGALADSSGLRRPLLLIHGMADDNVLLENSLQLVAKLQAKSRLFELMLYPGRAHGLRGRATRTHVWRTVMSFFERTLGRPSR